MLVWFVVATSKGYQMSEAQKCWCIGYAYRLAECKYYEQHTHAEEFPLTKRKLYTFPQEKSDLIYSLQFRKAYGGMRGDKRMLDAMTKRWYQRFSDELRDGHSNWSDRLQIKIPFITPPDDRMELSEWLPAAIDFHCCPQLITNLMDKFEEYDEEMLKESIWYCSSSITNKIRIDDSIAEIPAESKEIWHKIGKSFNGLAKFYLKIQH